MKNHKAMNKLLRAILSPACDSVQIQSLLRDQVESLHKIKPNTKAFIQKVLGLTFATSVDFIQESNWL